MPYRPGSFKFIGMAVCWSFAALASAQTPGNMRDASSPPATGREFRFYVVPADANGPYSEYPAAIYNSGLAFISNHPVEGPVKRINPVAAGFDRLYFSPIGEDGSLLPPVFIPVEVSLGRLIHAGPACIFANGAEAVVTLTIDEKSQGLPGPKLFRARIAQKRWIVEEKLFAGQEGAFSHPFLDEDNNVIYFVSDRPGGFGGTDIYFCRIGETDIQNAGPAINTPGNEMFPFINSDGFLYFTSDGRDGHGGMDLFRAACQNVGFAAPVNLGPEINSAANEFAIVFDRYGSRGYFCSDRDGQPAIYHFYLSKLDSGDKGE